MTTVGHGGPPSCPCGSSSRDAEWPGTRIHARSDMRAMSRVAAEGLVIAGSPVPDDRAAPMPLDYYVWLIEQDGAWPILVDTGFGAEAAAAGASASADPAGRGRFAGQSGVDPAAISDVSATHLHYDHAGCLGLFPNARFHVQESELAFATGKNMLRGRVRAPFDAEPVTDMVRLLFGERLVFHDGDAELAARRHAAWSLYGHAAGLMGVEVETHARTGYPRVDACHLYANLVREMPFPIVVDVPKYLDAIARLKMVAAQPRPYHSGP